MNVVLIPLFEVILVSTTWLGISVEYDSAKECF